MLKKTIVALLILSFLICSLGLISLAKGITFRAILGDVDKDGELTTTDFLKIKNHLLGNNTLINNELSSADADGDGEISATDYIFIKNLWINSSAENDFILGNANTDTENSVADSENDTGKATKSVTLYVPDSSFEELKTYRTYFDGTANGLLSALSDMGVFSEDVSVLSYEIKGCDLFIDLSAAFGKEINEARTSGFMLLSSFVNTFIGYYGVDYLSFTVEGETLETGLEIYDYPLEFTEPLILYLPNEDYSDLIPYSYNFNGTINGIVSSLVDREVLYEGTRVNSFKLKGDTAYIDLSEEFGVAVNEARTSGRILLGALANTVIEYYGVKYLSFTVEGEVLETGLEIYDYPLEFMKKITLWIPNVESVYLTPNDNYFNGSIDGVVSLLKQYGIFTEDVEVNSFVIEGTTAKVDFSKGFGDLLARSGTTESLIIQAFINTLCECYDFGNFTFTVEGEILETGLVTYDFPISPLSSTFVYIPTQDKTDLITKEIRVESGIENLIFALVTLEALPEGTYSLDFTIEENTAYINLSAEFGVAVNEGRTSGCTYVTALVNTIIKKYGVKYVSFAVEGEILETGLEIYDYPLEFAESLTLYLPNEDGTGLITEKTTFNGSIESLVSALTIRGALPEETKVLYFDKSRNTILVDLSEEFGVSVNEGRISGIYKVYALANTVIDYYDVEYFTFTVEGEVLETGLEIYDYPLEFSPLD